MSADPRPSILYVEPSYASSYGGSKRVLVGVLHHLDRERWHPRALFYVSGPYLEDLHAAGIEATAPPGLRRLARSPADAPPPPARSLGVRRAGDGSPRRSWPRRLLRELRFEMRFHGPSRRTAERLLSHVPDDVQLLHLNNPMVDDQSWFHVARTRRLPYITWEHGIWREPTHAYLRVVRGAAAVICLTPDRADQIRAECGRDVQVEVVPNGMDFASFRATRDRERMREELGAGPETLLLVTAGHFKRWKGQHLAVEASERLRRAGVDARWILCGSPVESRYHAELKGRIRDLDLEGRVLLLDERPDVADVLAACDLSVHTSVQPEPFGMVVVEALSVGTPVVGPREGAIPSIVREGTDSALYEPRNPDSLAEAISTLARDRSALRPMGAEGASRVRREFDVRRQVERITAIYERILTGSGTARGRFGT